MTRAEQFKQDFVGMMFLMAIAKPVIGGIIAFVTWEYPDDWAAFWGLTLFNLRMMIGVAFGYAVHKQVFSKAEACK